MQHPPFLGALMKIPLISPFKGGVRAINIRFKIVGTGKSLSEGGHSPGNPAEKTGFPRIKYGASSSNRE